MHKWRALLMLALAELLAMVTWFSASAVVKSLTTRWALDDAGQAWLTMSVQIGFVVGTFGSALFALADRIPPRRLFISSTLLAAGSTALIPFAADIPLLAMGLRFLTGVFLAGVYPVGMKIMATWSQKDRGLTIGLLVGALTVGSATPHLLNAIGGFGDWRRVIWGAAALSTLGSVIAFLFVQEGPYRTKAPAFRFSDVQHLILKDRRVLLAIAGYLGHMWEIYAMWAWLFGFLSASFAIAGVSQRWAALVTFGSIAIGSVGSLGAGWAADRIGRPTVTSVSMLISGSCALIIGRFFGGSPILITAIALIWGLFVVADSAQFSASVSELADKRYIGTALTLQTSLGFLLTLFSIRMIPYLVAHFGWEWAFAFLAIGPFIGIVAMQTLRYNTRHWGLNVAFERAEKIEEAG
jgi:MFS family permease